MGDQTPPVFHPWLSAASENLLPCTKKERKVACNLHNRFKSAFVLDLPIAPVPSNHGASHLAAPLPSNHSVPVFNILQCSFPGLEEQPPPSFPRPQIPKTSWLGRATPCFLINRGPGFPLSCFSQPGTPGCASQPDRKQGQGKQKIRAKKNGRSRKTVPFAVDAVRPLSMGPGRGLKALGTFPFEEHLPR